MLEVGGSIPSPPTNTRLSTDVRCDYPHADAVGRWTVFNIGGNDFRLVVEIVYATHKVFIRFVGTHQEYDRGRWK